MKARTACLLVGIAVGNLCGCDLGIGQPAVSVQLQSEDPDERIAGIHRAAQHKRKDLLPLLVERLSDSETEVRLFAEQALQSITGVTLGYHHYDPPQQRRAAIKRWRRWLRVHGKDVPATQPADRDEGSSV
ncbi:MAG: hypothetical protein ACLFV7_01730 [Phycisphaerae bacterium]